MSNPAPIINMGLGDGEDYVDVNAIAAPVMVRVTAPSSLEEGYMFDAVYNGEVFPVTVPPGGVTAGQSFEVPFLPAVQAVAIAVGQPVDSTLYDGDLYHEPLPDDEYTETTPMLQPLSTPSNRIRVDPQQQEAPLGSWKTYWFDCLKEGCCHPSLCNAICFPQILMGQVLTRMKLNCCGRSRGQTYKLTTMIWIFLTFVLLYQNIRLRACWGEPSTIVWRSTIESIAEDLNENNTTHILLIEDPIGDMEHDNDHCTIDQADILRRIHFFWFWVTTIILTRLRRTVRKAHGISTRVPCEDLCCSAVCGCCTIAQLARQTANYREQRAYCCTDTGLAEGWFGHRQEELERRHLRGHHLVHAHANGQRRYQQPNGHGVV